MYASVTQVAMPAWPLASNRDTQAELVKITLTEISIAELNGTGPHIFMDDSDVMTHHGSLRAGLLKPTATEGDDYNNSPEETIRPKKLSTEIDDHLCFTATLVHMVG